MNKKEFVEQFVINWLSFWSAYHYNDYCDRSLYKKLENPPIEDAFYLAEEIWKNMHEISVEVDKYLDDICPE